MKMKIERGLILCYNKIVNNYQYLYNYIYIFYEFIA